MTTTLTPPRLPQVWDLFLKMKPILWQAREELSDSDFVVFLKSLSRLKWPHGDTDRAHSLRWHAFEQMGWPEGNSHTANGGDEYILFAFQIKGPNFLSAISPRLVSRVERWKYSKREMVEAHRLLQDALIEFKESSAYYLQRLGLPQS